MSRPHAAPLSDRPSRSRCAGVLATAAALAALAAAAPPAGAAPSPDDRCSATPDAAARAGTRVVDLPVSSPWGAARGGAVRAAIAARADRRVLVCLTGGLRRSNVLDPRIRLRRGERLVRFTVSDPWFAWTTRRGSRETVHRRRIDAPARTTVSRPVATRGSRLVLTVDGTVVLTDPARRRVAALTPGRRARSLAAVARALRAGGSRARLELWGTRRIAVVKGGDARVFRAANGRATTCEDGPGTVRTPTASLSLARGVDRAPDGGSARVELEACSPSGGRLVTRLLHDDGGRFNAASGVAAIAGPLLVARTSLVANEGGGGSLELAGRRDVWVIGPGPSPAVARRTPEIVVASPAAGAFVDDGALWVADAGGLRRVPTPEPLTRRNTRLDLRGAALLVRTPTRATTVPLRPLATGAFAATAPFGGSAPPLGSDDLCGAFSTGSGETCGPAPAVQDRPDA